MPDEAPSEFRKIRCIAINVRDWDPSDETFEKLVSLLDARGQARVRAFKIRRDALSSLVGRLVPVAIYCLNNNLSWRDISIGRESKGRPFLLREDRADTLFDYNDTHDEDCVAVAMATLAAPGNPLRLGVDVMHVALPQGIPALADFRETLEDMTSPAEWQGLTKLTGEELLDALLRLWTAKEAVSKALGEGLSFPYSQIALPPPLAAADHALDVADASCRVRYYEVAFTEEKYLIAIAALNSDSEASADLPGEIEVRDSAWLLRQLETVTGRRFDG